MKNGERFDVRSDTICDTECQCEGPGECPVLGIYMNKRRYERCKYDCKWRKHYHRYYAQLDIIAIQQEMADAASEGFDKQVEKEKKQFETTAQMKSEIDQVMKEVEKEGVTLKNYTENKEGLGDLVGNVLSKLGFTEENVQKWSGIGGCGCEQRKKFLNKILPFRKKE